MSQLRLGVLLGERPDLLDALLDVAEATVVAVARDRVEAEAPAPHEAPRELFRWWPPRGPDVRERREAEIAEWFVSRHVDLVVAAGWLWILGPTFLTRFADRALNVDPTLLSAFPGLTCAAAARPSARYAAFSRWRGLGTSTNFARRPRPARTRRRAGSNKRA
jgi:folate-dependent phosphoribosylglycinamide formyltransferase PurN